METSDNRVCMMENRIRIFQRKFGIQGMCLVDAHEEFKYVRTKGNIKNNL